MRVIALAVCIVLASSALASGQAGFRLEFYADETLSSCELAVNTPGLVKVHMVVTGPPGAKLSSMAFRAPKPPCMTNAVWLTDVWVQPGMVSYQGNTQGTVGTGANVGVDVFFLCQSLPYYVGWIWYSVSGPADPCCAYAPSPGSSTNDVPFPGYLYVIAFHKCPAWSQDDTPYDPRMTAKGLMINANSTCRCDLPLATEPATWGKVKALYR
jgi:hypothetical protein